MGRFLCSTGWLFAPSVQMNDGTDQRIGFHPSPRTPGCLTPFYTFLSLSVSAIHLSLFPPLPLFLWPYFISVYSILFPPVLTLHLVLRSSPPSSDILSPCLTHISLLFTITILFFLALAYHLFHSLSLKTCIPACLTHTHIPNTHKYTHTQTVCPAYN